jgi:hypothetical protein
MPINFHPELIFYGTTIRGSKLDLNTDWVPVDTGAQGYLCPEVSKGMMSKRIKSITGATVALAIGAIMLVGMGSASALGNVPRNETVWGAGFGQTVGDYQPWNLGSNQAWTTYLMYEPMFGTNVANDSVIDWLGQSIAYTNSTAITITLRSDLHWTEMGTNSLEYTNSTPITTTDVQYTFKLLAQNGEIPSIVQAVGAVNSATFQIVSSTVLVVHILPLYAGTSEIMRQMEYGYPILPATVWQAINATYFATTHGLAGFANDWLSSGFTTSWEVASGMYLPYYESTAGSGETIAVRNANWWGVNDSSFDRLPLPQYWGYTNFATNQLALEAMESGSIDFDGNYLAGYPFAGYSNIQTYEPTAPYFPDKAVDMLVPNYNEYPLNETWLHQAMMSVLNYSQMSSVDSGYLQIPNIMLIPHDDAAATVNLNSTLVTKYTIALDATGVAGQAILSKYAVYNTTQGYWFTKQEVNGYHVPLGHWVQGSNASIVPWTILDFNGWTDVDAMDVYAAAAFSSSLKIQCAVDQGTNEQWGPVQTKVNSGQFDIFNMVMSGQLNMNMYERYFQMFSQDNTAGAGGGINCPLGNMNTVNCNYTTQLTTDINAINSASTTAATQAACNLCQTIIGENLPIIPLGGHPDWQVYSTTYWTNWPNSVTNPVLAGSPFAGVVQNANNLYITFHLQAGKGAPSSSIPGYSLMMIISMLGVAGLALAMRVRKYVAL